MARLWQLGVLIGVMMLVPGIYSDAATEANLSALAQMKRAERLGKLRALSKRILGDSPAVQIAMCNEGACLRAAQDISDGVPLLNLPENVLISRETVRGSIIGPHVSDDVGDETALAVYLLYIRTTESLHSDYVMALPAENGCLTRYSRKELLEFQDDSVVLSVHSYRTQQQNEFEQVVLPLVEALPELTHAMSRDAFAWAKFMVSSRVLTVKNQKLLVPLMDLINHRHSASSMTVHSDQNSKSFTLHGMTFEEGEQITMNYNPATNLELLLTYGFHDPKPNPYNRIELTAYSTMKKSDTQPLGWLARCNQLVRPPARIPAHLMPLTFQLLDPSSCADAEPSCAQWAQTGECTNNQEFMLLRCRTSCGVCTPGNIATSLMSCAAVAKVPPAQLSRLEADELLTPSQEPESSASIARALNAITWQSSLPEDRAALKAAKLTIDSRLKTALSYRLSKKRSVGLLVSVFSGFGKLEQSQLTAPKRFHLSTKLPSQAQDTQDLLGLARTTQNVEAWQAVLEKSPHNVEAWSALGLLAQSQGKYEQANRSFREAIGFVLDADEGTLGRLHCNLGVGLHSQGSIEEAIAAYEQGLQHDSSLESCWGYLAEVLQSVGQLARADAARQHTLNAKPNSGRAEL